MSRTGRFLLHLGVAALIGLAAWLTFGRVGFVNYDSAWSLDWMRELLAGGARPDLTVPFSPTPHPLSDLLSAALVPLSDAAGSSDRAGAAGATGHGAEVALVATAFLWIGVLGVVTFRLGQAWFGTAAGVAAAFLLLTREPVLSYGLRTYLDLPYAAFLLLALLAETRRPRNGVRTIAWITLAGLLRPEAWLLAAAYVAYLVWWRVWGPDAAEGHPTDADPEDGLPTSDAPDPVRVPATEGPADARGIASARPPAGGAPLPSRLRAAIVPLWPLVALALLAPLGWVIEGLILSGDPLQALTGTQDNAEDLDRDTGLGAALTLTPRRLGEIVREPVLLAALLGAGMSLWWMRRRVLLPIGALVAALGAFAALGTVGLPLLTRYLVFPAALVVLLAAAGLLGWRRLPAGHTWRRRWQVGAAVCLLVLVAFAPAQADRLDRLQAALALQNRVVDDLRTTVGDVVAAARADGRCTGVIALPNHRAIPQLTLWLGRPTDRERAADGPPRVTTIEIAQRERDASGAALIDDAIVLLPTSERVARGFILDKADSSRALPESPAGGVDTGTVGVWRVIATDAGCAERLRAR
ncbi:MAG: hypothetical protein AB7G37_16120 [Solirubrobacteraceae bacterium]